MRIFLGFLLIMLFSVTSFSQKMLTLNEAINIALQRNSDLQKAQNNIESYKSNVKSAYGNLLPSIGAQVGWRWTRSEQQGGARDFGNGIIINTPTEITQSRTYSAGVQTQWTLFNGLSNYANVSQSENNLESARFTLDRLKQGIVFQTIAYYYDVVNNRQLLKVKEEDVVWNSKNLETITERNKLGAVTKADVYAQQVRLGNAELAVIQTKNILETAKSNLLYYLGMDVMGNYTFSDSLSDAENKVINDNSVAGMNDLSAMVNQAMENRPDYKSAKLNLEAAYNGVKIAQGSYFPILSNSNDFYSSANDIKNVFKSKSYTVGLTLNIPIFENFNTDNRVQIAEVLAMNSKVDLNNIERDIVRGIQKTWLDLQASQKSLDVSRSNVRAAEENRRIEQEKYNLGSSTLLNVLIASSDFTNAQTSFINAQFAFITLSEQLKYQLGLLDFKKYE